MARGHFESALILREIDNESIRKKGNCHYYIGLIKRSLSIEQIVDDAIAAFEHAITLHETAIRLNQHRDKAYYNKALCYNAIGLILADKENTYFANKGYNTQPFQINPLDYFVK